MIVQFGVSNFLCFEDPTLIQLSTNSKETNFLGDICGNRYYKILKYISIFGKNASGKSSFIKSVDYMIHCVMNNDLLFKATQCYSRMKKANSSKESTFDIVIEQNGKLFQYGFAVVLQTGTIVDEYLYSITPSTKKRIPLFERKNTPSAIIGDELKYKVSEALNNNKLLLTLIGKNKFSENNDLINSFKNVFEYITTKIIIINKSTQSTYIFGEERISSKFISILNNFDFNISDIRKEKVDWNLLSENIGKEYAKNITDNLLISKINLAANLFHNNKFYIIKKDENGQIVAKKIVFEHFNSESTYDYGEESDGTLRILDFLPIIFYETEVTIFIDEIERSLSIDMVVHFIEFLRNRNSKVQIIYTTHSAILFDSSFQRKDSIYIVEKNNFGTSHFVRLNQFKNIYQEKNINARYLEGRYGGKPSIFGVE